MKRKKIALFVLAVVVPLLMVADIGFRFDRILNNKEVIVQAKPKKKASIVWKKYKVTAYCPCRKCSGRWGRLTATGSKAKQGRTIAVDPKVISYGTKLHLKGIGKFTAEDCGAKIKGNKLDIYFESHRDAEEFGVQTVKVRILKKGEWDMWINPFWAGVLTIVGIELLAFVAIILYIGFKHDDKE